jgi:hypothetical protein
MMWYFQHQRASQIIAERAREADKIRLARLIRLSEEGRAAAPGRTGLAVLRRAAARAVLAVGRSATRLAEALDTEGEAARAG